MRAIVYETYGKPTVLHKAQIPQPKPKEDELLIKVCATSVTSGDVRMRSSDFPLLYWLPGRIVLGLFKPKKRILGHEFSGIVDEIGAGITRFKKGDHVFGTSTGLQNGSYAEYICVPEKRKSGVLELMPQNLTFKEAAVIPIGSLAALDLLRKASIKNANRVIIIGALGSVGSYAVQVAKYFNAAVIGVVSTSKVEQAIALGCDLVLDYATDDLVRIRNSADIVFDTTGKWRSKDLKRFLRIDGRMVSTKSMTSEKSEDLRFIKNLIENKKLKPLIDRTFYLNDLLEAHAYVEQGHKCGNVSIIVSPEMK